MESEDAAAPDNGRGAARYRLYGREVLSEARLAPVAEAGEGPVDIHLTVRPVRNVPDASPPGRVVARAPHREAGREWFFTATAHDDGFTVRVHGACDFVITPDLSKVQALTAPGTTSGYVSVLFTGTVMAFLLDLQQGATFHAGAVRYPGTTDVAAAVMAPSGKGKSTIVGLMTAAGAGFITDDLLALEARSGVAVVAGGSYELRLRERALHVISGFDAAPQRRGMADGRTAVLLAEGPCLPARLGCVLLPVPDRGTPHLSLRQVGPKGALRLALSSPRLSGWAMPEVLARHFELASLLAASVPFYELHFPWSPAPTVASAQELLRRLEDVGGPITDA